MDELEALLAREYVIRGRRAWWRMAHAFRHLRHHLPGPFPVSKCYDVTADYILARTREGAKPATIHVEMSALSGALAVAKRAGRIHLKPAVSFPVVRNARRGFIPHEATRALFAALDEPVRSLCLMLYVTGWRPSEVKALTWDRVDWKSGTIRLDPGTTKNGDGRVYPFRAHHALTRALSGRWRARRGPYVFQRDGDPVRSFRAAWKSACSRAGLGHTLVYDLKRSCVRNMERARVPRSVAMAIVGHRTESIYRRYAICDQLDLERGVRLLGELDAEEEESRSSGNGESAREEADEKAPEGNRLNGRESSEEEV